MTGADKERSLELWATTGTISVEASHKNLVRLIGAEANTESTVQNLLRSLASDRLGFGQKLLVERPCAPIFTTTKASRERSTYCIPIGLLHRH